MLKHFPYDNRKLCDMLWRIASEYGTFSVIRECRAIMISFQLMISGMMNISFTHNSSQNQLHSMGKITELNKSIENMHFHNF